MFTQQHYFFHIHGRRNICILLKGGQKLFLPGYACLLKALACAFPFEGVFAFRLDSPHKLSARDWPWNPAALQAQHRLMPGLPKLEKKCWRHGLGASLGLRAPAMIKVLWVLTPVPSQPLGKKWHFVGVGKLVPSALLLIPAGIVSTLPSVFLPSLSSFLSESDSLHTSMFSLPYFTACACWACSSFRTTRTSPGTTNPSKIL